MMETMQTVMEALQAECFRVKFIPTTQINHYNINDTCFSSCEIMNICCLEAFSVN